MGEITRRSALIFAQFVAIELAEKFFRGDTMKTNERKKQTLRYFSRREWTRPRRWAADVGFYPTRAANSYLLRLHRMKLLRRGKDFRGFVVYRLSRRGAQRLLWFDRSE